MAVATCPWSWLDRPINGAGPTIVAGQRQRQVVLPEMQDVGNGAAGDVGAVVDRKQRAVPSRRIAENLERGELVAGLHRPEPLLADRALVAQLDEVDATGERRIGELGEVVAFTAGVGAEVERGGGETLAGIQHDREVSR